MSQEPYFRTIRISFLYTSAQSTLFDFLTFYLLPCRPVGPSLYTHVNHVIEGRDAARVWLDHANAVARTYLQSTGLGFDGDVREAQSQLA